MIHSIEVSPHDKGTVYIAASRYKFNDFANYTYKSTDYGKTWSRIGNGIQNDDFIKVVREDPQSERHSLCRCRGGFYVSFNGAPNGIDCNLIFQWYPLLT